MVNPRPASRGWLSVRAIKTIDRIGAERAVAVIRARGEKV
jgi:hypothetical protein